MTVPCRRTAALFLVALSATITIAVLSTGQPTPVHASHSGGADFFLIDMDPTGNTATSIGSIESCARINENNILDADEDAVDAVDIDIVTGPSGIPASNPAIAYSMELLYPAPSIQVIGHDQDFLLLSAPGSFGDFVPPFPDTDGVFLAEMIDFGGAPTAESGPGVLERVTLQTIPGASSGLHTLTLERALHVDDFDRVQYPDNALAPLVAPLIPSAGLAIDAPCPPPGDLQGISLSASAPASAPSGVPFNVEVTAVIANSGPVPVDAEVMFSLSLPPVCHSESTTRIQVPSVGVSTPVVVGPHVMPVTCFQTGTSNIDVRAGVSGPDLDPTNNIVPTTASTVVSIASPPPGSFDAALDSAKIYWTNGDRAAIQRSSLNGGSIETLVSPVNPDIQVRRPIAIDPLEGRVYWLGSGSSGGSSDGIRRSNLDGSGEQLIVPGVSAGKFALDIVGRKLYWATSGGLFRANLDGTSVEVFASGSIVDVDVDPVESVVYWSEGTGSSVNDGRILRRGTNGGTQTIISTAGRPWLSIDAAARKLYAGFGQTSPTDGRIDRMNLDGAGVETILAGLPWFDDLAVAGGKVYWIEPDVPRTRIMAAGLDGSAVTQVISIAPQLPFLGFGPIQGLAVLAGDDDGIISPIDNCPNDPNPNQADFDQDGAGDACDLCPDTPSGAVVDNYGCSLAQVDADGDGECDEGAPSLGPPPGCLRSVAVGGIAGLLQAGHDEAPAASQTSADRSPLWSLAVVAAAMLALAAFGWVRRRVRTS